MTGTSAGLHPRTIRIGAASAQIRLWTVGCTALLIGVVVVAFAADVSLGSTYPISPVEVLRVLFGGGDRPDRTVVQWRLSRVTCAFVVGAALGIAGAITQALTRNPLVSPDVLGISEGGAAAAVILLFINAQALPAELSAAALAGSAIAGLVVYLVAYRRGIDPFRLILVGVGVSALLQAVISYVLLAADTNTAARARVWVTGDIGNTVTWDAVWPVALVLGIAIAVAPLFSRDLTTIALGDEVAASLGVRVARRRRHLLWLAVALTAISVAAVGPIAFIALAAPQIAMRLLRGSRPPLITSGLTGATLLLGADMLARGLLPWRVPVGVVTAAIGAPVLLVLVVAVSRRTRR